MAIDLSRAVLTALEPAISDADGCHVCGYSNREISRAVHKSEGTVKNQVSAILAKLGVRDRTRAVLRAIELGLFSKQQP
jgi:hypothetical protein